MGEMSLMAEKDIGQLLKLGYHKNERVEARKLKKASWSDVWNTHLFIYFLQLCT